MNKSALLIGSTGLVGGHLLRLLLESPHYTEVVTLTRKLSGIVHPHLREVIFDFDQPDPFLVVSDDVFCAIGTTLAKAGSKEAQYKIDCTYPTEIARRALENGAKQYLLVSSVGADANSSNFYLRTKGELERNIREIGYSNFVAARPSFLLGKRGETRIGEQIGIGLSRVIGPLMLGSLRKYRGIEAEKVAAALIRAANQGGKGSSVLHYDALVKEG